MALHSLQFERQTDQIEECHSELCRTGGNGARARFPKGDVSHRFSKASCRTPFITCSAEGVFSGRLFLSVSRRREVSVDPTFELFFGRLCVRSDAEIKRHSPHSLCKANMTYISLSRRSRRTNRHKNTDQVCVQNHPGSAQT